jgi:hypothetical protein
MRYVTNGGAPWLSRALVISIKGPRSREKRNVRRAPLRRFAADNPAHHLYKPYPVPDG